MNVEEANQTTVPANNPTSNTQTQTPNIPALGLVGTSSSDDIPITPSTPRAIELEEPFSASTLTKRRQGITATTNLQKKIISKPSPVKSAFGLKKKATNPNQPQNPQQTLIFGEIPISGSRPPVDENVNFSQQERTQISLDVPSLNPNTTTLNPNPSRIWATPNSSVFSNIFSHFQTPTRPSTTQQEEEEEEEEERTQKLDTPMPTPMTPRTSITTRNETTEMNIEKERYQKFPSLAEKQSSSNLSPLPLLTEIAHWKQKKQNPPIQTHRTQEERGEERQENAEDIREREQYQQQDQYQRKGITNKAIRYLIGDGEKKAFQRNIYWLSQEKDQYPLLRDIKAAEKIFGLLQQRSDELGNNNCYLNLCYSLLECLRNVNQHIWENFLEILHDYKNPDLLPYVQYVLDRKADSFHITHILNPLFENLAPSKNTKSLSYLTLFRLLLCKKQLSRSLILFIQNMLSYRYWSSTLGYKTDIFSPPSIAAAAGSKPAPLMTLNATTNATPTLTQLVQQTTHQKKKNATDLTKTTPCTLQNSQAPLLPDNEIKFWNNHYVFITNVVQEKKEVVGTHHHVSATTTRAQGGADNTNTTTTTTTTIMTKQQQQQQQNPPLSSQEEGQQGGQNEHDTTQGRLIYTFESAVSRFLPFTISQIPSLFVNTQEEAQDLHVLDLLQEFSQPKSIPSALWTGMENADPSPPISFFTYGAATGQIRLTQGVNFLQSLCPTTRQLTSQTLPADTFKFPETFLPPSSTQQRGVILKSMTVELFVLPNKATNAATAQSHPPPPPLSANLLYQLITPDLKPYLIVESTDILYPQTSNPLRSTLDLFTKLEKDSSITSATLIKQFFLQQGFLFSQPTLILKDLPSEQSFKINLKWETIEGSQNLLSCYTLAAYLHSLIHKNYTLHFSYLKRDADAGNSQASTLLSRLTSSTFSY